jgi:hypothetical protein
MTSKIVTTPGPSYRRTVRNDNALSSLNSATHFIIVHWLPCLRQESHTLLSRSAAAAVDSNSSGFALGHTRRCAWSMLFTIRVYGTVLFTVECLSLAGHSQRLLPIAVTTARQPLTLPWDHHVAIVKDIVFTTTALRRTRNHQSCR